MSAPDGWAIPGRLSQEGRAAAEAIVAFLRERGLTDHGGGGKFYTPQEWEDRGEQFGLGSLLVVTHDGGDHAAAFNWDYEDYDLVEDLRLALKTVGVYVEQCTSWYSAVYPIWSGPADQPWVIVNRETGAEVVDGVVLAADPAAALALAVQRKLIPTADNHAAYRP